MFGPGFQIRSHTLNNLLHLTLLWQSQEAAVSQVLVKRDGDSQGSGGDKRELIFVGDDILWGSCLALAEGAVDLE
jgi:hypothetical protein